MKTPDRIDFICIGAAKSATTWLYHNLSLHPDVSLSSTKEIHYFNKYQPEDPEKLNSNYGKDLNWYHGFFENSDDKSLKGEFSTSYLKYANCATDIYDYNPSIKIIARLRNPIDRLFSHYTFLIQRGFISPSVSFEECLQERKYMIDNSLYFKQLSPYFKTFPKDQIKIMYFDDLKESNTFYSEVLEFLELDSFVPPQLNDVVNPSLGIKNPKVNEALISMKNKVKESSKSNLGKFARAIGLNKVYNKIFVLNSKVEVLSIDVDESTRSELKAFFRNDIEELEKLLNKELSSWKD